MNRFAAKCLGVIISCFLLSIASIHAQQLAFPGAEGAGRFATGGRGTIASPTTVFKVTSLDDNNVAGTLRYAVNASTVTYPNRTIVFEVSGTIHLTSPLTIRGNTTIAGQTAPGSGICIADYPVSISGNNVILRYIRIRMGDKNQNLGMVDGSGNGDALGSLGYKNLIIDHCSISWSSDEACTIYRGDSTTIQWTIVSEPLNYSYHFETGDADFERHGYGGIWGSRNGSFHHNIIAHAKGRLPRFAGSSTYPPGTAGQENVNFYNNVIYNWEAYSTNGGEGGNYNILNNYYKYGPNTSTGTSSGVAIRHQIVNPSISGTLPYPKIFMEGNVVDGSAAITDRNWLGVAMAGASLADTVQSKVDIPFNIAPYTLESATNAYESVLNGAGALLPRRDTLDRRIVNDIRFRVGKIIDVQGGFQHGTAYNLTVDAWPNLQSKPAPADADNDGMPDGYETANALNPNNADDRATVAGNGYTNLENYLNGVVNTSPEIFYTGVVTPFQSLAGQPSSAQQYAVHGVNLTGNVTIIAPVGFEVSVDNGATWFNNANPLIISPAGNVLAATNVQVRMNKSDEGSTNGFIKHYTTGSDTTYVAVSGTANAQAGNAAVIMQWPMSVNNQDDAGLRNAGLHASQTILYNLFLSNGTTVGSVPAYGTLHGQAFGPSADGSALWTTASGGPGGNLSRVFYEQFEVTTKAGFAARIDSILLNASFYNSSSNTKLAILYSRSAFVSDSANVTGGVGPAGIFAAGANGAFTTPVLLANQTAGNTNNYRFALNDASGVTIGAGETLTIRMYFSCGSSSTGRYAKIKDVALLGQVNNALPVSLQHFDGWEQDKKVALHWTVADNESYELFVIERKNAQGNFEQITSLKPNLNRTAASYESFDYTLLDGNLMYRLKMLKKNGTTSYSRTVYINRKLYGTFSVYPNPVGASLTLTHAKALKGAEVNIVNAAGQIVMRQTMQTGATQTNINSSMLKPGKYNVMMRNEKGVLICGFVKL